jgi:hypothetical protein
MEILDIKKQQTISNNLVNEQDYENKSGEFSRSLALACSIKTNVSENKIKEI